MCSELDALWRCAAMLLPRAVLQDVGLLLSAGVALQPKPVRSSSQRKASSDPTALNWSIARFEILPFMPENSPSFLSCAWRV